MDTSTTLNNKIRRRHLINSTWRYVLLIVTAFIMLYPIIWLFGASFKNNAEIFSTINFLPKHWGWGAYVKGWKTSTQYAPMSINGTSFSKHSF